MRDIKFRAKAKGNWLYGSILISGNLKQAYMFKVLGDTKPCRIIQIAVDKDTVGQFTGLLDSKGKEVYEGDIVRWYDPTNFEDDGYVDYPEYGIVIFSTAGGTARFTELTRECQLEEEIITGQPDAEHPVTVIGNIHDNYLWVDYVKNHDNIWLLKHADPDLMLIEKNGERKVIRKDGK